MPSLKKPRKGRGVDSEHCVQYHQKQWLDKTGIWDRLLIFHVANERMGSIGAMVHFKRMGVRPGVADWLAFPVGEPPIAIEVKRPKGGKMSENQEKFRDDWLESGGVWHVARSLEEFQHVIGMLVVLP